MLLTRFSALGIALISTIVAGYYLPGVWGVPLFVIGAILSIAGIYDLFQPLHSVRRNYPIIGQLRWYFEDIRPEIRQYLIEGEYDETPFSRSQRSLVYARSKMRAASGPLEPSSTFMETGMSSSAIRPALPHRQILPHSAS